jgi:predicted NodU family carbamoyl transferase
MNILEVHIGHDSVASLVVNSKLGGHIAEERLTRTKHYGWTSHKVYGIP